MKKKKWISPVATLIRGPGISRSCGAVESSDDDANRWLGHGPRPQTLLQPNIHLCQVRHEADRTVINVFFSLSSNSKSTAREGTGRCAEKTGPTGPGSLNLNFPSLTYLDRTGNNPEKHTVIDRNPLAVPGSYFRETDAAQTVLLPNKQITRNIYLVSSQTFYL